jgi:hypothetical protein
MQSESQGSRRQQTEIHVNSLKLLPYIRGAVRLVGGTLGRDRSEECLIIGALKDSR